MGIIPAVDAINLKFLLDKLKNKSVSASKQVINLLFPSVCDNCLKPISENDGVFCDDCWSQLLECAGGDYCRRCGKDVSKYAIADGRCGHCQSQNLSFDGIARAGKYEKTLKKLLLKFKFGDKTEFRKTFGFLANSALEGSDFYDDIDYFVPVPLHWRRRLSRGFNQSLLIAQKLTHPKAKINNDLIRCRYTMPQVALDSAAARKKNVEGAFAVRIDHEFENKNICLVDDIKTTNATLNECSQTLKQAGALKVYALVIAVADQKDQQW